VSGSVGADAHGAIAVGPRDEPGTDGRRVVSAGRFRHVVPAIAQFGALVTTIGGVFVGPYVRDRTLLPFGWDTLGYIWRTEFVHAFGIGSLTAAATHQTKPLGYRPLYLVVSAALEGVLRERALVLAWILPAVLAIALGLGIFAFVVDATGLSPWWGVPIGIGVAASPFVAVTGSYATNLAAEVVLFACATLVVREVRGAGGRGTRVGIATLVAASVLTHWMFAMLGLGVLVAYAAIMAFTPWAPSRDAPSSALGALAAGAAVGILGFAIAPERPGGLPSVGAANALIIGARRLPEIPLAALLALAAVGVAVILLARDRRFDAVVPLLLSWIAILPVGFVAWYVLHLPLPPYRTAAFVIALPLVVLLIGPALALRLRAYGRRGLAVGVVTTVLLASWMTIAGANVWAKRALTPASDPEVFAQLGTVASYLEGLDQPDRLVFVTSKRTPLGALRYEIAAALPPAVIAHVDVVRVSPPITEAPAGGAPTFYLTAYNRDAAPPGAQALGPGTFVMGGADPRASVVAAPAPRAPAAPSLFAMTLGCLLIIGVAGIGWSFAFVDSRAVTRAALAPAVGIAVLGLTGFVASRLGLGFACCSWILLAIVAAGGWLTRPWLIARSPSRADDGRPLDRGRDA
jgi:hypothetical protein